jgi:Cu+-exporting ATPase
MPTVPTDATDRYRPVYMGLPAFAVLLPRLWVALPLTLAVAVLSMGPMLPGPFRFGAGLDPRTSGWIQAVMTTPVFWWCGWFFLKRFARSWRTLDFNMFTLTVTGTGAAYGYSLFALLFPAALPASLHHGGHVPLYFESAATITTLVLIGQILEQRAHARTGDAIRALLALAPPTAARLRADGSEETVPLETVRAGDRLRVRPGEKLSRRRRRARRPQRHRRVDAHRRTAAAGETPRRHHHRRHRQHHRHPRRRGPPRGRRHRPRPDRAPG